MAQITDSGETKKTKLDIIWYFLRPYKWWVSLLLILFLLSGAFEAATIAAIYPILDAAFAPGAENTSIIITIFRMLAEWIPVSDLFISYCVVFIIFSIFAFLIRIAAINIRIRFISRLVVKKQNEIYAKFIRADYQYFVEHKQGELLYNTLNAPQQLSTLILSITELISQALLSVSVLALLFSLSWIGAIAILALGTVYIFLSRHLGTKVSYKASRNELQAAWENNTLFNESISGIKQLKAFAVNETWLPKFQASTRKLWSNVIKRISLSQMMPVILLFVIYVVIAVVVLMIKLMNPAGYLELIPVFGAFAFAVFRMVPFISTVGSTTMGALAAMPDCEVMYRLLNTETASIINGTEKMDTFRDSICFNNVRFSYKGRSETVKDLTLVFEKGKSTAIVGRSGSGKTTIINLILRLIDVDAGEILIDGRNIKEYDLPSWLQQIGYVSQDSFILNDTIEQNIIFGSDGYTHEQVIKAAMYADAHAFISELPEGYDTVVGEKGMRLSGGQSQRIAVARAMIREPEILIFDEATNNLDNISELAVQNAIERISKEHTVILVAHRLSTIENADKIVLLDQGSVLEEGTHTELMAKNGSYWRLHQRQDE